MAVEEADYPLNCRTALVPRGYLRDTEQGFPL